LQKKSKKPGQGRELNRHPWVEDVTRTGSENLAGVQPPKFPSSPSTGTLLVTLSFSDKTDTEGIGVRVRRLGGCSPRLRQSHYFSGKS